MKLSSIADQRLSRTCPVCKATASKLPYPDRFPRLFECPKCRHAFMHPMPLDKELDDFYAAYPDYGSLSPLTIKRYRELLQNFEPFRKNNRLLEVGCGHGAFLELARLEGWEVTGTEYSDKSIGVIRSKGITVYQGELNPSNFSQSSFDVVLSLEVIEHVRCIEQEATAMTQLVRPGGLIYLTTPNYFSLSRRILQANWGVLCYPEHLHYFNRTSLRKLFDSAGTRKLGVATTGISVGRLREGWRKRHRPTDYRPFVNTTYNEDQQLRSRIFSNAFLEGIRIVLNTILTITGLGDTLKGRFIKPEN